MENAVRNLKSPEPLANCKAYHKQCEIIKSNMALYAKDLRFLQQLLSRYFEDLIKHENLDEVREGFIRFQDFCFASDRLEKRVNDQLDTLKISIENATFTNPKAIYTEQLAIQKKAMLLSTNFGAVKKEMFGIANSALQFKNPE